MSSRGEFRDWRPGDGLVCRYARQAPREIPCGPPVRTAVKDVSAVGRKSHAQISPLCENHADLGITPPSEIMTAATRAAQEGLVVAHYAEYMKRLQDEIDQRIAASRASAGQIETPEGAR